MHTMKLESKLKGTNYIYYTDRNLYLDEEKNQCFTSHSNNISLQYPNNHVDLPSHKSDIIVIV